MFDIFLIYIDTRTCVRL